MKREKIIAGVYPFPFLIGDGHDTNFSLIKGNKIFSLEEGKVGSVAHSTCDRFPEKSMLSAFKYFNIHPDEVDHWVFGGFGKTPKNAALKFFFHKFKAKSLKELSRGKKISIIKHHDAHAGLAIYGSGFKEGMFVCIDAGGDEAHPFDTYWGIFKKNRIKTIGSYNKGGCGVVRFHNFICEAIGYLGYVDNGKVMGLAAYGQIRPQLYKKLRKLLVISKDGFSTKFLLKHNPIKSRPRFDKLKLDAYQFYKVMHGPNPPKELTQITKPYSSLDIAATGQKVVEDVTLKVIKNMLAFSKQNKIVCSGGFFQNISFNKILYDLNLKGVYIPSAPNDAGLSLGGALYKKMLLEKSRPKKQLSPFLGIKFKSEEIKKILNEYNLVYKKSKNICKDTAQLLAKGKVVGWFQGRSELGPRSLGARSIIADPRNFNNKAKLNQLLKKRDWFMPYAPSVLYDKTDYFYGKKIDFPYMSFSIKVVKNRDKIPAAVHIDQSSRPHTVKRSSSSKFYDLIKNFYKITGVPAILNTSFNRHGISIIQTPRQAIEHLLNGCVELLAIEDYLVYHKVKIQKTSEKVRPEDHYLVVEKLKHILEAFKRGDSLSRFIINEINSEKIFKKFNITIKNRQIFIGKKRIYFPDSSREVMRETLFPLLKK